MTSHIRKGLITGAPAFNSGGLGLSIGSRVGGIRRMISKRAPDGGKAATIPEVTEYKIRGENINVLTPDGAPPDPTTSKYVSQISANTSAVSTTSSFAENTLNDLEFNVIVAAGKTITVKFTPGTSTKIESLIEEKSKNNYEFKFPTIGGDLIKQTNDAVDTLYFNGTIVNATDADSKMELQLGDIGYVLTENDEFASFKTAISTYISDKTFEIIMTSDTKLKVKSANLEEIPMVAYAPPAPP